MIFTQTEVRIIYSVLLYFVMCVPYYSILLCVTSLGIIVKELVSSHWYEVFIYNMWLHLGKSLLVVQHD